MPGDQPVLDARLFSGPSLTCDSHLYVDGDAAAHLCRAPVQLVAGASHRGPSVFRAPLRYQAHGVYATWDLRAKQREPAPCHQNVWRHGAHQTGVVKRSDVLRTVAGRCEAKPVALYRLASARFCADSTAHAQTRFAAAPDSIIRGSDDPYRSHMGKVNGAALFHLVAW